MRTSKTMLTVAVLLGVSLAAHAQRTPGGFGTDEKSLDKMIVFPELRGDATATITCQGILKTNGKLADGGCYTRQPGDEVYIEAINKAVKKARFAPAVYEGREIGVYFQYRVRFVSKRITVEKPPAAEPAAETGTPTETGAGTTADAGTAAGTGTEAAEKPEAAAKTETRMEMNVTLYPNPGYLENVDAYGEGHIAAQRSVTKETWQKVCPSYAHFTVWARAHVAEDGSQSNISITPGSGLPISRNCEQAIIETMNQSVFIPAYADGEPVPSTYIEPFGS